MTSSRPDGGPAPPGASPSIRSAWAVSALLVAAVFLAFLPVLGNGFVDYDDNKFLTENPSALQGLTPAGIGWALRSTEQANWFPLTRLSHLADMQLYGLKPAGHHLTSLLLHAANAMLLFLVLRAATGASGRSAVVSALFALHPLRVESVAWVSERKDVLSVLFWVLALAAYVRYVRRPGWGRYLLVAAVLALGLMAKPLLVTLPAALLLLDFWPLGRWRPGRGRGSVVAPAVRLVLEKVPLFGLSAVASVVTFWAQREAGAMSKSHVTAWSIRLGNAALSYVKYLVKTLYPQDLSPVYFFAMHRPRAADVTLALLLLAVPTAAGFWAWRRRPEALVGWLWYLGTLVPMIGIVQVGSQAMADRYSYIPQVGIFVAVVWSVAALAGSQVRARLVAAAGALSLLALLGVLTNLQARHWKDTTTLFRQALRVDPQNLIARVNLGIALTKRGELEQANEQFRLALQVSPRLPQVHYFLGTNLSRLNRREEALRSLESEIAYFPRNAVAYGDAGSLLRESGRYVEAEQRYREALRLDGMQAESHRGLGLILLQRGDVEPATYHLNVAVRLNPRDHFSAQKLREIQGRTTGPRTPPAAR